MYYCTIFIINILRLCAGNDNIHMLTSLGRQKMRVDMGDYEGINVWADYTNFLVGSEEEEYKLWSIGKFNGTAGESGVMTPNDYCI